MNLSFQSERKISPFNLISQNDFLDLLSKAFLIEKADIVVIDNTMENLILMMACLKGHKTLLSKRSQRLPRNFLTFLAAYFCLAL